jgi:hypothetical protein
MARNSLPSLEAKVKKPKEKRQKQLTVHHVTPRSRNGSNDPDNLVLWDSVYHDAFHRLFGNLLLHEAIEMLIITSQPGETWDAKKLEALRSCLRTNRGSLD